MSQHTEEELVKVIQAIEADSKAKDALLGRVLADMERIQRSRFQGNLNNPQSHKKWTIAAEERTRLEDEIAKLKLHKTILKQEIDHMKANQGQAGMPRHEVAQITERYNAQPSNNSIRQNNAGNNNNNNNNNNTGNIGRGVGKVAVGAVGIVGGALRGTGNFFKALGSKKGDGGYKDPNSKNWGNFLFFILFFFIIVTYEMLGGGYLNNIDIIRFIYAIMFLVWGWFSLPEERNSVWMVFVYTLMVPLIFGIFGSMSFISENISNAVTYHTIILFAFPAILYFMIFSEGVRLPGAQIGRFALIATILILALGFTDSAQVVNRLQNTGGDTGFDLNKAFQGISGGFSGFSDDFLAPMVCALNPNCGFNNWLTSLTEPFANDKTTVHEIQNKDLGIYVENLRMPASIDVTGMQFQFLPEPIGFYVRAPIPQQLGFEICQDGERGLKGFTGICEKKILLKCEVQDSGGTRILPDTELSIADVMLSGSLLGQCNVANPRLGTKRVNVSIIYPFVTNTYKFIRALDATQVLTRQASEELERLPPNYIISTGGPVIIESDENDYIAVRPGEQSTTNILIRLKAQNNMKLVNVSKIEVYLPVGMEFDNSLDNFCIFNKINVTESRNDVDVYNSCVETAEITLGIINGLESNCTGTDAIFTEREAIASCRALDICSAQKDNGNFERNVSHENAYEIDGGALALLNQRLSLDSNQKIGNEIAIGCQLRINSDEFLDEHSLEAVTDSALNIVSYYTVEHQATGTIRFTGTQNAIPRVSQGDIGNMIFTERTTGLSAPLGEMPVSSANTKMTFDFGNSNDPLRRGLSTYYHRGLDLAATGNPEIIASWDGKVFRAISDQNGSKSGYGNMVAIESTDTKGKLFYHIYAHLNTVSVSVGDIVNRTGVIGTLGNTGSSTGPHLHFEIRSGSYNGPILDPLTAIKTTGIEQTPYFTNALARAQARSTYTTPIVAGTTDFPSAAGIDEFINALREKGDDARAQFAERVRREAETQGVEPALMIAIAMQESSLNHYNDGRPGVKRNIDAIGLMQVRIPTAKTDCSITRGKSDSEILRMLEDIDTNIKCGIEVFRRKPESCPATVSAINCECIISGLGIPLNSYDGTYQGKIRAYPGWSCTIYPTYVNQIQDKLTSIVGVSLADSIATSSPPPRLNT